MHSCKDLPHPAASGRARCVTSARGQTKTANDRVEAIAVADGFQLHVILLDIGMPKLNGYETARLMRQKEWGRRVLLVALTGWGQETDRMRQRRRVRRSSHEACGRRRNTTPDREHAHRPLAHTRLNRAIPYAPIGTCDNKLVRPASGGLTELRIWAETIATRGSCFHPRRTSGLHPIVSAA